MTKNNSDDLIDFLEAVVLGEQHIPEEVPKKEEASTVSSSPVTGPLVDVLGSKKLRRLQLAEYDPTADDPTLPTKRYFTEKEFQEKLSAKISTSSSSWVSMIKEKKSSSKSITTSAVAVSSKRKERNVIKCTCLPDATMHSPHHRSVSTLLWRERDVKSELLISASKDETVKFFKTSSALNPECIDSIRIRGTPVQDMCLSSSRESLYCLPESSRRIFTMDLGAGKSYNLNRFPPILGRSDETNFLKAVTFDNNLCLLDTQGKIYHIDERVQRCVRVFNSGTKNACILKHPDLSNILYSADTTGEIFKWDLGIGRCVSRKKIDGVLSIGSLGAGPEKRLVVGASSGHVVVASGEDLSIVKEFKQLAPNPISHIASHPVYPELQLVCASDATRMFSVGGELPFTYIGWPVTETRAAFLGTISAASISPKSFVAVGNTAGSVKLFHLNNNNF